MMRAVMRTSAVYIVLITGVLGQYSVQQDPYITVTEGEDVQINCTYTGTEYSLHWYHAGAHKIQSIFFLSVKGYKFKEQSMMFLDTSQKFTYLYINKTQVEDSAVYYCAMDYSSNKLIFGSGTTLIVLPKTERTIPSVYQLSAYNPEEGLPNTVCLVTDFPSPNKTLNVNGNSLNLTDAAVLDRSSSDVWRYSAVVWDENNPSKNLPCKVTYDEETVPQENILDETTQTCSSLTVNERFHTNPGMNTLSVSVLGLRMLTAKAIIFNLIITMRLWSS